MAPARIMRLRRLAGSAETGNSFALSNALGVEKKIIVIDGQEAHPPRLFFSRRRSVSALAADTTIDLISRPTQKPGRILAVTAL